MYVEILGIDCCKSFYLREFFGNIKCSDFKFFEEWVKDELYVRKKID